jgi:hypothetical protein
MHLHFGKQAEYIKASKRFNTDSKQRRRVHQRPIHGTLSLACCIKMKSPSGSYGPRWGGLTEYANRGSEVIFRLSSKCSHSHQQRSGLFADICPQYPKWRASSISRSRNQYGRCYIPLLHHSPLEFTRYYMHLGYLNIRTTAEGTILFLLLTELDN